MRLIISIMFVALFVANSAYSAKVPAGSRFQITMTFKDNNNQLRNKQSPGYAIPEDGYARTIWVEGPYDPGTPCQISNAQRQGIKLVRTINYFAYGHNRTQTGTVPNPWNYHDYCTPNFSAALE